LEKSIEFYKVHFGFTVDMHPSPYFAIISLGDLKLLLSVPNRQAGGGQSMPDGTTPSPGGWNRIQFEVKDIESHVNALRAAGVSFRNDIVSGVGGKQILLDDPSGNPIELFEYYKTS